MADDPLQKKKKKPETGEASRAAAAADQFPAGLRVLVVDDDRACLKIMVQMLRKCLYRGQRFFASHTKYRRRKSIAGCAKWSFIEVQKHSQIAEAKHSLSYVSVAPTTLARAI
ncbi:hypothetical protein ACLOJK_023610 [Asimina triloba]